MARVILIIVFIVSSESTFNIGGRVLNSFHSCLNYNIVEALIYIQNWIRKPTMIELRGQPDEV